MAHCKKCNAIGTVVLRKSDVYCESCFLANMNHKFRACIGKNKILSATEKVLVCLLGGPSSMVLLDMIHNGLALNSHKKLRIIPYFLLLKEHGNEEQSLEIATLFIDICSVYGFDIYVSCLSESVEADCPLQVANTLPTADSDKKNKFQKLLNNVPASSRNDFLTKMKRKLFINYAKKLDCKFVFTPETTSELATNLLSNIAMGRGSQVQNDIGFSDNRDDTVRILRPMKDISEEELTHYINVKGLKVLLNQEIADNSLQSVIKSFVTELQENCPATISTICKTADKIGMSEQTDDSGKCVICESDLDQKRSKLSALEATNYSRMISLMQPQEISKEVIMNKTNCNSPLFPYIYKSLCYGCSRTYLEMSNSKMPNYIQNKLQD